MKQWVQRLIEQLDYNWASKSEKSKTNIKMSEEKATILFLLDVYNKNLVDIDTHPIRRVRETLDDFGREIVNSDKNDLDDVLFRFRQFFASYRVSEYTYIRKTFEDFKAIIWNFVEHLSDEVQAAQNEEKEIAQSLKQLKEAVESDSIEVLRAKSREFIDYYHDRQNRREQRRSRRMKGIKKNLDIVKQQLVEADRGMREDHLTGAFNRRSFDEHIKHQRELFTLSEVPVSMILMDIDFFKKINDNYGHDVGDFILKEFVKILQNVFGRENDFVARIGGEEFAVILPSHTFEHAIKRADECMARVRREVFVQQNMELRFTISMGIAQLLPDESTDQWIKRADEALYTSKNSGRNRYTIATPHKSEIARIA